MEQVKANFDTLAAARQLKAGGFDDNQVAALVKFMRISGESAVTKADLSAMDASLRREIGATRTELRSMDEALRREIDATRADLRSMVTELRGELATSKAELRAEMNAMANKMLLSQLAVAGLLFAAIKTFT